MLFKVNVWSFIIIMVVLAQTAVVGILLADKYENSCHCDYECYCSEISDNCHCDTQPSPISQEPAGA